MGLCNEAVTSIELTLNGKKDFRIYGLGVYIFFDKNRRPLYAGWSGDMNRRIIEHFNKKSKFIKEATHLKIFFNEPREKESWYIMVNSPIYNTKGVDKITQYFHKTNQ